MLIKSISKMPIDTDSHRIIKKKYFQENEPKMKKNQRSTVFEATT